MQPAWSPPSGDYVTGLKLYNSLTRKKVSCCYSMQSVKFAVHNLRNFFARLIKEALGH